MLHRLEENIAAVKVALSGEDLTNIGNVLARIEVHGDRYPAHLVARAGK